MSASTPDAKSDLTNLISNLKELILIFALHRKGIKPSDLHSLGIHSFNKSGCNFLPCKILKEMVEAKELYQEVPRGKYNVEPKVAKKLDCREVSYNEVQEIFIEILNIVYTRFERQPRSSSDVRRLFGKSGAFVGLIIEILKRKGCIYDESDDKDSKRKLVFFKTSTQRVTENTPVKAGKGGSRGEQMVEQVLNQLSSKFDLKFEREVSPQEFGKTHRLDFLVNFDEEKIIIEFDGKQHREPVEHFGGVSAFEERQKKDKLKDEIAAKNGYHMLRLSSDDHQALFQIRNSIEQFLEKLKSK